MDFSSNNAIYIQIAEYICENIILKKWNTGERIPSVRELSDTLKVNPNTIMKTFTFLQEKEIISNRRGIGYFVSDAGFSNARNYKKEKFINTDLENFFNSVYLLNIDFNDLKNIYEDFRAKFEKDKQA
ncbi:MAG: GntR family transcriptional regulator [Melioribacteraceae bacterium]|nr:GntR family transcriptional regulator [Melioribacteraceae bacterium]